MRLQDGVFTVLVLSLLASISLCTPYNVTFRLETGVAIVTVHPEWAPIGAARFQMLVNSLYFDNNGIFRVVPNFVCQWGINGDPAISTFWKDSDIANDPVLVSNSRGRITYAAEYNEFRNGTCCRTTQLFVNYINNSRLDALGFAPFAEVVVGMEAFDNVYSLYGQEPDQDSIYSDGNSYLRANFTNLTYIQTVRRGPTSPDQSNNTNTNPPDTNGLTTGEIIGIVVLALVVVLCVGLLAFWGYQKWQQRQKGYVVVE